MNAILLLGNSSVRGIAGIVVGAGILLTIVYTVPSPSCSSPIVASLSYLVLLL
jgi:hypothetical protein